MEQAIEKHKARILALVRGLRIGMKVTQISLALTTYAAVGIFLWGFMSQNFPPFAAWGLTVILTYLAGYAIDGSLDKVLAVATSRNASGVSAKFMFGVRAIFFVLVFLTGTLSYFLMPEITSAIVRPPDNSEEMATIRAMNADLRASVASQDAIIAASSRTVQDAKAAGRKLVQDAIASNPAAAKLWKDKNQQWVRTDASLASYRRGIQKAEERARQMVRDAEREYLAAQSAKQSLISARSAAIDSVSTSLTSIMVSRQGVYSNRLKTGTRALLVMDVSWVFLLIAFAGLIGMVDGHEVERKPDSMEVILSVWEKTHGALMGTVLNMFKIRTDGRVQGADARTQRAPDARTELPGRKDATHAPAPADAIFVRSEIDPSLANTLGAILGKLDNLKIAPDAVQHSPGLDKICQNCGQSFSATTVRAKYCSPNCRKRYNERKHH